MDLDIEDFGQKFIGVRENGSLELHGKDKVGWTRLTSTLSPFVPAFGLDPAEAQPGLNGFALFVFNYDGTAIYTSSEDITSAEMMEEAMANIAGQTGVVVMTKGGDMAEGVFNIRFAGMVEKIEIGLGLEVGSMLLNNMVSKGDVWTCMMEIGDASTFEESLGDQVL